MTTVLGDITAQDDYTHPLGPEENFNESMYFNFFDQANGHGGFLRMGNRANEGYAEVTLCLYPPGGEVLFNYKRPEIANNDGMDAGGMRFDVLDPLVKHRTSYEGSAVFLSDPTQMADPGAAFRENPRKRISLELIHEAIGPAYGSSGAGRQAGEEGEGFARAHYEQHMRATGTLRVDDESFEIDGTGLRDHSWGPRYWQAIHSYRWLTCAFGPELCIMVSEVTPQPDASNRTGIVIRDGAGERIRGFDLNSRFAEGTPYHTGMTARLDLDSGEELTLEGEVKGFIPLRNRRAGMVTHIGEGMTRYRCLGHVGFGISEYLDQVQ
jgi:hypothetical protein